MLGLTAAGRADETQQGFEGMTTEAFRPPGGKASEGSALSLVQTPVHGGQQALKLNYSFSGRGYVEFNLASPFVVAREAGPLRCSLWCYGAGKEDFAPLGLRLVDAGGETFQYSLGEASGRALNGAGWRQISVTFDPNKPESSWGAKHEGVPRYPVRFLGFGIGHRSDLPAKGEIVLDDISFTTGADATAPVSAASLRLEPITDGKKPLYFYNPGSTVSVRVQAANVPPAVRRFRWEASGFDGTQFQSGDLVLDAQNAGKIDILQVPTGITYLTATALNERGDIVLEGRTRFAAVPLQATPPAPLPNLENQLPFVYGIGAHLGRPGSDLDSDVALMAALGFRAARSGYSWHRLQPQKGVWKWEDNDKAFETMARYGITPTPGFAYSTIWGSTGDTTSKDSKTWTFAPPKNEDFTAYVAEVVKRYGKYTRYWEVWNEPDVSFWLGTAQQYADTFDATYDAIHRVQPNAVVMNGGFSETKRRPTFIPDWQAATRRKPDVFAYHSHMAFANMLRASSSVKTYLKDANWNMPVWLNEAGFSSVSGNSERDQAIALVKKMSSTPYLGFNAYFWYDLRDDGTDPKEIEHHFGLVQADYTPKAAAVAAHTLMSTLAGQRFARRVSVQGYPQVYALAFEKPDQSRGTLVLWNEDSASIPLLWTLPGKAKSISLMGVPSELKAAGNTTVISAGPEPVFIDFQGATQELNVGGSVLEFVPEVMGIPGETVPLSVTLNNPLNQAMNGQLNWTLNGGWSAEKSSSAVSIPARSRREMKLDLRVPAATTEQGTLKLSFDTDQLPGTTTALIPLKTAVIVPRVPAPPAGEFPAPGEPVATLGRLSIVSLFEVAPLDNLLFRGDNDLNASLYLARVPQGLAVSVRVQDDIVSQNEVPGEEWKGDSLQLGLALPGGENYEWVAARTTKGPQVSLSLAPPGTATGRVNLPVSIERQGTETLYRVILPTNLPGGKSLPDQLRFTFLVNDNDGGGRKGWIEWTPGIGKNKDPNSFRSIVVR